MVISHCVNSGPALGRAWHVVSQCTFKGQRTTQGKSALSFYSDDQIQAARLVSKPLFPLSPVTSPGRSFNIFWKVCFIFIFLCVCPYLAMYTFVQVPLRPEKGVRSPKDELQGTGSSSTLVLGTGLVWRFLIVSRDADSWTHTSLANIDREWCPPLSSALFILFIWVFCLFGFFEGGTLAAQASLELAI